MGRAKMDETVEQMVSHTDVETKPTISTINMLLDAHAKGGDPSAAAQWYSRLAELNLKPDVVTFNIMIVGFGKARDADGANQMMEEVQFSHLFTQMHLF